MKYKPFTRKNVATIEQLKRLDDTTVSEMDVVARVLPFKTNNYVVDELIDWDSHENDPMYTINFPRKGLMARQHFNRISGLLKSGANRSVIKRAVQGVRLGLNPHPAGQLECNIPELDGRKVNGIQHKYRETMLVFPAQGQTCHAYCTFCFR